MIQTANCEVRLLGDIANSVPKSNVTPAEIAVLRAIHGPESVVRIKESGSTSRSHRDEYDRLAATYGNTVVEDGVKVFYKIFPETFDPKLPTTFKEVGAQLVTESSAPLPDLPELPEEVSETETEAEASDEPKRRRR